jgi:cytochrome c biogenesis protein
MTKTTQKDPPAKNSSGSSSEDSIYAFLSSVRFAILLLSLIAVACVIGTLIPQQVSLEDYSRRYAESTVAIFQFLGLTDVFHSYWFLGLLGLFVVNLVLCTVRRFVRFRASSKPRLPSEKALSTMPLSFVLKGRKITQGEALFKGYKPRQGIEGGAILEKGMLSRYGVYIIHTSIVVILLGSIIGLLFGYRGSITLRKEEVKNSVLTRTGHQTPLGFEIRLKDFTVDFYPSGEPKEYMSRVEILDQGKIATTANIRVNHPLSYKGTSIYQASYGQDPFFIFDIGGQEVRLSQGSLYKHGTLSIMVVRFEQNVHDFGPGIQIAYMDGSERKLVWFLKNNPKYAARELMGVPIKLNSIANDYYTGLEISRDPGVWVVWTGFALILFGLYTNFFMYHRRIYLLETANGLIIAGMSARNKEAFKEEFEKWRKKAHDMER